MTIDESYVIFLIKIKTQLKCECDDVKKRECAAKILTKRKSPALGEIFFDVHVSTGRNHDVAHEWVNVLLNDNSCDDRVYRPNAKYHNKHELKANKTNY